MKTIELKSLIGKHKLTGVDYISEHIKMYDWSEDLTDCQGIKFILDGVNYLALEDPSDGYRSCMKHCIVTNEKVKNKFKPVEVYGIMKPDGNWGKNEVIQFYDTKTNKIVLEIGTDNYDDYYPSFVGYFEPKNLIHNQDKSHINS